MDLERTQLLVLLLANDPGFEGQASDALPRLNYLIETCRDASVGISRIEQSKLPTCLILGPQSSVQQALALQPRLRSQGVPTILVVEGREVDAIAQLLRAGAVGVLKRPVRSAELLAAVERVEPLARRLLDERLARERARQLFVKLTPRERQVCMELSHGSLNKQIASELAISEKTVKYHRGQIMRKLEVGSIAQLVRLVDQLSLLTHDSAGTNGSSLP